MRSVDIANLRFDFDLTFAALLMNADGTIYHRFGGRNSKNALVWTSMPTLVQLMTDTLVEHAAYQKNPRPPKLRPKRTIADIPLFAKRDAKKRVDCVHCHNVHDFEREQARQDGTWKRSDLWVWPSPERVGLELDTRDQALVRSVAEASPAAKSGIAAGDRLVSIGTQRVRTVHDVQSVLERIPFRGGRVQVTARRGGEARKHVLELGSGWRRGTPKTYAWRPYKWGLQPAHGFGGPALSERDKKKLGISPQTFAFRVQYLVTWGPRAKRGRNAARAGIRPKDVIVSFGGRSDFVSMDHLHAWVRLEKKVGDVLEVELLRAGERRTVKLRLVE